MAYIQLRAVVLAGLTAVAMAACTAAPGAAPVPGAPLRVVATLNVWGSIAEQLGGDRARVSVVDTGADPHDYEPTAQDAREVADADLVIVNDIGYDSWARRLLGADPGSARRVVSVGEAVGVPDDGNPHQWNDPGAVHVVVDAVAAAYRDLRPVDAGYFDGRRTELLASGFADYDAAVATIRDRFAGTPVGASESLLVPLAEGLGLRLLTPRGYLEAEHDDAEPSAADVAATQQQLVGREVAVWMYDARSTEPGVLRLNAVAAAAGVPVVAFTEAIPGGDHTFQQWQLAQLTALLAALEGGRDGA